MNCTTHKYLKYLNGENFVLTKTKNILNCRDQEKFDLVPMC